MTSASQHTATPAVQRMSPAPQQTATPVAQTTSAPQHTATPAFQTTSAPQHTATPADQQTTAAPQHTATPAVRTTSAPQHTATPAVQMTTSAPPHTATPAVQQMSSASQHIVTQRAQKTSRHMNVPTVQQKNQNSQLNDKQNNDHHTYKERIEKSSLFYRMGPTTRLQKAITVSNT